MGRLPFDIARILTVKIQVRDYAILLHSTSSLSLAFWCNSNSRGGDYEFLTSYLRPGDVYLDIGANIGTTLIPAAKRVEGGQALGFEPHPEIFRFLQENVALNGLTERVVVRNCALGNRTGHVIFSNERNDDRNRVMSGGKGVEVEMMTLDDIGQEYARVDLIKVDVEGYEKYVFEGGRNTLAKTECVYFEVCEEHFQHFGYSIRDVLAMLEELGFTLFRKEGERAVRSVDRDHLLSEHHTNLIAMKDVDAFLGRTGWRRLPL